jgi:hypothetical protein
MKWFGVSFGEGNIKVGNVLTFSLPSITTCPGASSWCLQRCYAAKYEALRPSCRKAYESNLALARDPQRFTQTMIGVLPRILPCFRIHVSGDFLNPEYVLAWVRICQAFPQTFFWSYTRSWNARDLIEPLERLRGLPNVQLLASTDATMPLPPRNWRRAYVDSDPRALGVLCLKQAEEQESCLVCGYCFRRRWGDVVFKVH